MGRVEGEGGGGTRCSGGVYSPSFSLCSGDSVIGYIYFFFSANFNYLFLQTSILNPKMFPRYL